MRSIVLGLTVGQQLEGSRPPFALFETGRGLLGRRRGERLREFDVERKRAGLQIDGWLLDVSTGRILRLGFRQSHRSHRSAALFC